MKTRKIKSSRRNLKQCIKQELIMVADLFDSNNENYDLVMEELSYQSRKLYK